MSEKKEAQIKLFVPGRLCLFGEHSDWAGMHRMINSEIIPGSAIVCGVEQGIYAVAEKSEAFVVESSLSIYEGQRLECGMKTEELLTIAKEGGFFSYVAGVASYINDNYSVGGVKIKITKMTLPIKSGLSSSAAICVLVARAFNQLYHLKMNTQGEMLVAFQGEQRTPSRCGRLDQACAYGVKPVFMEFDGTEVRTAPITAGGTFYWVIADLGASKDTVQILSDLNQCYPFPKNEIDRKVHEALGADNQALVKKAVQYLEDGDAEKLGRLMVQAQENFDKKIAPASLQELKAPVLHEILQEETITNWIYGGKGVGSQGDGSVQFLAKDADCQKKLLDYLKNTRNMSAFSLTIKPGQKVRRAVIPVAGFGTRLFPETKIIKKDFMPLVDADGQVKPVLLILLEQLEEAGIEEICLIIGEGERQEYERFFHPLPKAHFESLSEERRAYVEKIMRLGKKVTYVTQKERLGFGHAVFQSREFTKKEPVLLLLGDMVYQSNTDENCCKQVLAAYENCGKTVVSIHDVSVEQVVHYGILHGQWENREETLLSVDGMCEKPQQEYAEEYLGVLSRKKKKDFLAIFGPYVLTPEVYEQLEENIRQGKMSRGEYQLTDALESVREKYGLFAFRPEGKVYDVGNPESYREAVWNFGKRSDG